MTELSQRSVPETAIKLFEAPIGRLIINFAFIDHALDFWLMELFPLAERHTLLSEMPHQLGRKLTILQKCFEQLAECRTVKDEALRIISLVGRHNKTRNTIAHGAISHYEDSPEPTLVFVRLSYEKESEIHFMRDEAITLSTLARAIDETGDTVAAMHKIAMTLGDRH
jgi:hypothetical protein